MKICPINRYPMDSSSQKNLGILKNIPERMKIQATKNISIISLIYHNNILKFIFTQRKKMYVCTFVLRS